MIEPTGSFHGSLTLDRRRITERALIHFNNDLCELDDYQRVCIQLDTADQVRELIAKLNDNSEFNGHRILRVNNRFAKPSPLGFRDIKWYIPLDESDDTIACFRAVASSFYKPNLLTLSHYTQIAAAIAAAQLSRSGKDSHFVLVLDNFWPDDSRFLSLVYGFDSHLDAKHYATTRFKHRVKILKEQANNMDQLQIAWLQLGENMAVGSTSRKTKLYICSDDLWEHLIDGSTGFVGDWEYNSREEGLEYCRVEGYNKHMKSIASID